MVGSAAVEAAIVSLVYSMGGRTCHPRSIVSVRKSCGVRLRSQRAGSAQNVLSNRLLSLAKRVEKRFSRDVRGKVSRK